MTDDEMEQDNFDDRIKRTNEQLARIDEQLRKLREQVGTLPKALFDLKRVAARIQAQADDIAGGTSLLT
jgi:predicted nuclease with TOPRIM domain